jgi:hypothetical protein
MREHNDWYTFRIYITDNAKREWLNADNGKRFYYVLRIYKPGHTAVLDDVLSAKGIERDALVLVESWRHSKIGAYGVEVGLPDIGMMHMRPGRDKIGPLASGAVMAAIKAISVIDNIKDGDPVLVDGDMDQQERICYAAGVIAEQIEDAFDGISGAKREQ